MQQEQRQQSALPQNRPQYQHSFTTQQMRYYFYKPSRTFLWLLIGGVFLFVVGLMALQAGFPGGLFIILGLALAGGGGFPLLIHYGSRPTDDQYGQWVSERLQPLYKKALQRLHLDESQCESIIEVQGGISSLLQLTKKFPEKEIAVKRLPDGLRHYSINVCTYIFLTKDDIAIYSGYINAFAQNERFEDADHYYYKDIVGVSTSGPIYTSTVYSSTATSGQLPLFYDMYEKEKEIQRQGFFVRVSNGEVVGTDYATKVALRDSEKRVQIQGVDEVVAALLSLLRDHNVTAVEANRISRDLL